MVESYNSVNRFIGFAFEMSITVSLILDVVAMESVLYPCDSVDGWLSVFQFNSIFCPCMFVFDRDAFAFVKSQQGQ